MISGIGTSPTHIMASEVQSTEKNMLGKDDFLYLLVTQLKYQDPLNPLDSTDFTSQLAQFSSLEQLENANKNLEQLKYAQIDMNNSQATAFIGKTVFAYGDHVNLTDGVAKNIYFELASNADSVYLNIYDNSNNLVKTIENGPLNSGKNQLSWDGRDNAGNKVSDGNYNFEVFAYDRYDIPVDTVSYTESVISGVTYIDGETVLNSGNINIPLTLVFKVTDTKAS